jgi:hypothetical protein
MSGHTGRHLANTPAGYKPRARPLMFKMIAARQACAAPDASPPAVLGVVVVKAQAQVA